MAARHHELHMGIAALALTFGIAAGVIGLVKATRNSYSSPKITDGTVFRGTVESEKFIKGGKFREDVYRFSLQTCEGPRDFAVSGKYAAALDTLLSSGDDEVAVHIGLQRSELGPGRVYVKEVEVKGRTVSR